VTDDTPSAAAGIDPDESPTQRRLVALELKLLDLEDLADRLNDLVVRQQDSIDRLRRTVERLERQAAAAEPATFRSLRDELPPHW
jgi:SlyX protein